MPTQVPAQGDLLRTDDRPPGLTVLSYGAGQDSDAILCGLTYDAEYRRRFAPGRLLVICADTGDEHADTLEHIAYARERSAAHDIEFIHITPDLGFHTGDWTSLLAFYRARATIGTACYGPRGASTCSHRLKIQPIYGFLEAWIAREYRLQAGRKRALYDFADRHGPIRVILGIARGEEHRLRTPKKLPVWQTTNVRKHYPLIEEGMDRADCQAYIRSHGEPVPPPSNCRHCHWKSPVELLWTWRFDRPAFEEWVDLEAAKLRRFADRPGKNYGVYGTKTLPEALAAAKAAHGHMSDHELHDWRMSHGHCIGNAY